MTERNARMRTIICLCEFRCDVAFWCFVLSKSYNDIIVSVDPPLVNAIIFDNWELPFGKLEMTVTYIYLAINIFYYNWQISTSDFVLT
jgi:hypothetical protein